MRYFAGGDGRTGAAALANGDRWSFIGAVTANTVGVQTFDEQLGVVGRVTYLPFKSLDGLVHVGANVNLIVNPAATGPNVPPGAATPVRLRERPELRVDGTRLVGIVTRADLVRAFGRSDEEIGREIAEDVLRSTLWIEPDSLEVIVEGGVVTLAGRVETRTTAHLVASYVRRVPGVVAVHSELEWRVEDLVRRRRTLAGRVAGRS